ncbi:MAG: hypothetical protein FWE23_10335 [Chitinivibrionia bacterium]|nr:hypothetical protein [Chitinivibrionia bacterium]
MKRAGFLIEQIADINNLHLAFYKARKGKDLKDEVIEYRKKFDENIKKLHNEIISGKVDVGNYHYFKVYDPKERTICAASFSERVLHHAIINVCHYYFEKQQIEDSFATRIGKGQYEAINRARLFTKKYKYYEQKLAKGIWSQEEYCAHIKPLFAFVEFADTYNLRRKIVGATVLGRPCSQNKDILPRALTA